MQFKDKDPEYWNKRKREGVKAIRAFGDGRPMNLESPSELWELSCEYFQRCDDTPWERRDYKGKDAVEVDIPTTAPYLWSGFEDFLFEKKGILTLKDYRTASRKEPEELGEKYKRYAPFSEVVTRIDQIMTTQKISGAMVGAYNANLVARLEGLADKTETEVTIKETKIGFE
jgi:hypothetical protein